MPLSPSKNIHKNRANVWIDFWNQLIFSFFFQSFPQSVKAWISKCGCVLQINKIASHTHKKNRIEKKERMEIISVCISCSYYHRYRNYLNFRMKGVIVWSLLWVGAAYERKKKKKKKIASKQNWERKKSGGKPIEIGVLIDWKRGVLLQ